MLKPVIPLAPTAVKMKPPTIAPTIPEYDVEKDVHDAPLKGMQTTYGGMAGDPRLLSPKCPPFSRIIWLYSYQIDHEINSRMR
jgi:hypothetical protein